MYNEKSYRAVMTEKWINYKRTNFACSLWPLFKYLSDIDVVYNLILSFTESMGVIKYAYLIRFDLPRQTY